MASYSYLAREAGTGREIRSSIDAASEQAAIAALLGRNLLMVSIQERIGKKGKTCEARWIQERGRLSSPICNKKALKRIATSPEDNTYDTMVCRGLGLAMRLKLRGREKPAPEGMTRDVFRLKP